MNGTIGAAAASVLVPLHLAHRDDQRRGPGNPASEADGSWRQSSRARREAGAARRCGSCSSSHRQQRVGRQAPPAHHVIQQKAQLACVRELSVNWLVRRLVATAAAASQNAHMQKSMTADILPRIWNQQAG